MFLKIFYKVDIVTRLIRCWKNSHYKTSNILMFSLENAELLSFDAEIRGKSSKITFASIVAVFLEICTRWQKEDYSQLELWFDRSKFFKHPYFFKPYWTTFKSQITKSLECGIYAFFLHFKWKITMHYSINSIFSIYNCTF